MKKNIEENIKKAIETVRPSLQADGGDIKFLKWEAETGTVAVELIGHCSHCPMAAMTLKHGVEAEIKKHVPEVKEVVAL